MIRYSTVPDAPISRTIPITPSDTVDCSIAHGLLTFGAGTIRVILAGDEDSNITTLNPVGDYFYDLSVRRVLASGTTVTSVKGAYR